MAGDDVTTMNIYEDDEVLLPRVSIMPCTAKGGKNASFDSSSDEKLGTCSKLSASSSRYNVNLKTSGTSFLYLSDLSKPTNAKALKNDPTSFDKEETPLKT